jgi:hypothetical protein
VIYTGHIVLFVTGDGALAYGYDERKYEIHTEF